LTDPNSTRRLRNSIEQCEETVELLLNYRRNGDPFWNLLYCAPLFNEKGQVSFFLGGQINCSTTIRSCTDVLRVLSVSDDDLDKVDEEAKRKPSSVQSRNFGKEIQKPRSSFFKSWRKYNALSSLESSKLHVRDEAGMEGELLNRVGKMNFKIQVEAFYTAYSKVSISIWTTF
jgi:phototropin